MFSDCGSKFKGAVNELTDVVKHLDKDKIKTFPAQNNIIRTFNPPSEHGWLMGEISTFCKRSYD